MSADLILTITDRSRGGDFSAWFREQGATLVLTALGRGTATTEVLDCLGLEATEKAVLLCMLPSRKGLLRKAAKDLWLDVPGRGVMMAVPVSSIGGASAKNYLLQGEAEDRMEKKSRFIATVRPVQTEEEALAFIEEMKKKYWDARHNCYVYSVGKNREYTRCSDDGEPSGTAGRPMLDVILGEDIYNVAAVVTRYFGGILLGTGGLVRAYSRSLQEGLAASTVIEKTYGISMEVVTDYTGIGKIQYIAGEQKLPILDSEYTDRVVLHLLVPADQIAFVEKAITEGTNGRAKMKKEKDLYYSVIDGEVKVFTD